MEKFSRSVSLVCWAYNEETLILDFLRRAYDLMHSTVDVFEIILVDDGSTDRTYSLALEFQKTHPELKIIKNPKNLNVGLSFRKAIQTASREFLFWQTVDWSYDLGDLRNHLVYLHRFDVVQGTRRKPIPQERAFSKSVENFIRLFGVKYLTKRSDTLGKAIISVINYSLIRLLFRVPFSDFQNVTFYPTELIKSVQFESKSSFINPEGLIKTYWLGKSFKEVEINFIPRATGIAKGTKCRAILNSISDIFRLWAKWILLKKRNMICKGTVEQ